MKLIHDHFQNHKRTAVGEAFPGRGWTYAQAGQFRAATRDWAAERAGRGAPLLLRVGES